MPKNVTYTNGAPRWTLTMPKDTSKAAVAEGIVAYLTGRKVSKVTEGDPFVSHLGSADTDFRYILKLTAQDAQNVLYGPMLAFVKEHEGATPGDALAHVLGSPVILTTERAASQARETREQNAIAAILAGFAQAVALNDAVTSEAAANDETDGSETDAPAATGARKRN